MALDYKPDNSKVGDLDIVHGAILSEHEGRPNTVRGAIDRRLKLGGAAEVNTRHALVLPSDATDLLNSIGDVIADYERRMIKDQRDLLTITGLRFDPSPPSPPRQTIRSSLAKQAPPEISAVEDPLRWAR